MGLFGKNLFDDYSPDPEANGTGSCWSCDESEGKHCSECSACPGQHKGWCSQENASKKGWW